jgi:hypothetical protein
MKKYVLLLPLLFTISANMPSQQSKPRVSLDLGSVNVWLGMSKAEVLNAVHKVGYRTIDELTDGKAMITSGDVGKGPYYTVKFTADRLSYAERSWFSDNQPFDAVLGALSTVSGKSCDIQDDPKMTPEMNIRRIYIYCGERSILILKGTLGKNAMADVFERIGSD